MSGVMCTGRVSRRKRQVHRTVVRALILHCLETLWKRLEPEQQEVAEIRTVDLLPNSKPG